MWWEAENFILKPKSDESKKQLAIEVHVKGILMVEMVINLVFKKLKQIKFFEC